MSESDDYNNSEDSQSDVSLDEDDEELIWRVFYSQKEKESLPEETLQFDSDHEFTDLSDIEDEELVAQYKELKRQQLQPLADDEKKRLLITSFTEDQMERFEAYRRMTVNKGGVKKICNGILGHSMPQNIAVLMAGLSKLMLGEIITLAFEVQEREYKAELIFDIEKKKKSKREALDKLSRGEDPAISEPEKKLEYLGDFKQPLTPDHIREAWRIYRSQSSGAFLSQWRSEGESDGRMFR